MEKMESLTLTFNPYTYVRTAVMRSLLLKQEDYETLIKMGPEEIVRFLQTKGYKEFSSLGVDYRGISLVEKAVKENLIASFKKLRRISDEQLLQVIDGYLLRYDVRNIKIVLRVWKVKANPEEAKSLFVPAGKYSLSFYEELLHAGPEKGLKLLKMTPFGFLEKEWHKELFWLETAIDRGYYSALFTLSQRLKDQGALVKDFIQEEIFVKNLLTLLKLPSSLQAYDVLVPFNDHGLLDKLARAQDIQERLAFLEKSHYAKFLQHGIKTFKETGSLIELEKLLRKHLLQKIKHYALHNILSVDTILAFLFQKDLEIKNILVLYKGKVFGLSEEKIRENLIV